MTGTWTLIEAGQNLDRITPAGVQADDLHITIDPPENGFYTLHEVETDRQSVSITMGNQDINDYHEANPEDGRVSMISEEMDYGRAELVDRTWKVDEGLEFHITDSPYAKWYDVREFHHQPS